MATYTWKSLLATCAETLPLQLMILLYDLVPFYSLCTVPAVRVSACCNQILSGPEVPRDLHTLGANHRASSVCLPLLSTYHSHLRFTIYYPQSPDEAFNPIPPFAVLQGIYCPSCPQVQTPNSITITYGYRLQGAGRLQECCARGRGCCGDAQSSRHGQSKT